MTRDAAWYKWLTEVRRFKQCESCRTTRKENAVKKLHLPICSTVFRKSLRMSHFITLQAKFIFGEILLSKNYHEKFVKIAWCKNIQIHTIRKVKFLSKNSIMTKNPTFSRVFHPNFFWQFFLWNQSCQLLKSSKPKHFHEFFTQIFFDNFSREIKVVNS